jgi:hypothetical protein
VLRMLPRGIRDHMGDFAREMRGSNSDAFRAGLGRCKIRRRIDAKPAPGYGNHLKVGTGMAYKVFVSYSTKDIPNVDALRTFLQFPDVECFVSEYAVMPGAPIAATTKMSILACDLFVLLWSKNAMASEWVSQEIGIAHGNHKPILPLCWIWDCPFPDLSRNFVTLRHIRILSKRCTACGKRCSRTR